MITVAPPSFQSLLIELRVAGRTLSTGTAFVTSSASGPHLLTNRHNVTGRNQDTGTPLSKTGGLPGEMLVWHNAQGALGSWISKLEPLFVGGAPRWKEHPVLGSRADIVALPLGDLLNVDLHPYDVAATGPDILVGPADQVSVVGFPFGLTSGGVFAIWATGFLASDPDLDFNNLPVQLVDCRTRPGQSGSPVIAYRSGGSVAMANRSSAMFGGPVHKFIGMYSGRINSESDLGLVWKAAALNELVCSL